MAGSLNLSAALAVSGTAADSFVPARMPGSTPHLGKSGLGIESTV